MEMDIGIDDQVESQIQTQRSGLKQKCSLMPAEVTKAREVSVVWRILFPFNAVLTSKKLPSFVQN